MHRSKIHSLYLGFSLLFSCAALAELGAPYYSGRILPTPQEILYGEEEVLLFDSAAGSALVPISFSGPAPLVELADRLMRKRLGAYWEAERPLAFSLPMRFMIWDSQEAKALRDSIDFLQGRTSLPEHGYALHIGAKGVLGLGQDSEGLIHALASFLQLCHLDEQGRLMARHAQGVDWPVFLTRYTSEYHLPGEEFFDWMMLNKLNGFAASYPGMRWEGLDDSKRTGLKRIGAYVERYQTLHFMLQFHVGGRRQRPVDVGNPEDVARLLKTIEESMRLSQAEHIMLCYDDVKPELQPMEKERFASCVQAHGVLADQVYQKVMAINPKAIVSFCSPYYQGRGHHRWRSKRTAAAGRAYLKGLADWKNKEVRLVWTGPVTESKRIVPGDIKYYKDWTGREEDFFYWDNTWHYHQPLRNFHAVYPENFVEDCADKTAYVNINGVKPIGRFFALTANDYYWNPAQFDSKGSRKLAVEQMMGADAVAPAERLYALRGEDYFVFFCRDVDLPAFEKAVADLALASRDKALAQYLVEVCASVAEKHRDMHKKDPN